MQLFSTPEAVHLTEARKYREERPKGVPYSIAFEGPEKPDRTKIYRHWRCKNGPLETLDPNVRTAHEMFEQSALRNATLNCLGWRPWNPATKTWGKYQWLDYETVRRKRAAIGAGLVEVHNKVGDTRPKHGVGLWCNNRPEWQIVDLGCMSQSLYSVSIYDTLGPDTAQYIINHAELTCVAASLPKIPALLKIKSNCPSLKIIVSLDPLDAGEPTGNSKRDILRQMAEDVDIQIYTLDEIEAIGAALNRPYNPPTADDVVTINYTSGTTGNPKGVILTHRNAVAAASNASVGTNHGTEEIICSFLPLAHIFARMAEAAGLWGGIQIGYFHGDTLGLLDDLKILKPTLLIVVPRLLNRFGGGIKAASIDAPGFKGALSRQALSTKLTNLNDPVNPTNKHMFYDRIWSRKVRQQMGMDRIKALVSGAAPLDGSMQQFLRASWGAVVAQGYGMTESYASTMVQMVDDFSTGNLGGMLPGAEACLQSIPDMEYYVTDKPFPRGEILLRGHTIFKGYLKDDEETAKSFTEDGWFKTGDVGAIDAQGRFKVIDRKKNVLKLAQGEYIAPERIEGVYLTACNYLAVAFVHGDSDKTFPVAMFGIQPDVFATWASKVLGHSISETDIEALKRAIKDPKVVAAVRKDVDRAGRKAKFAGFERVRGIKLYLDPFSIENDLMTPTLKLKRPKVVKAFRQDLDELYAGAEEKDQKVKARL